MTIMLLGVRILFLFGLAVQPTGHVRTKHIGGVMGSSEWKIFESDRFNFVIF